MGNRRHWEQDEIDPLVDAVKRVVDEILIPAEDILDRDDGVVGVGHRAAHAARAASICKHATLWSSAI